MAKANKDFFILYSGSAMYKLLKRSGGMKLHIDPFRDRHSVCVDLPYWQGTLVGIDISLSQKNEFTELLEFIRETYIKAIGEQKKAKFKKPKFI
jgi:hypothetical protein